MHYPGKKSVYVQIFEFIDATVSEFRFCMRLRNVDIRTERVNLTKKSRPPRYKVQVHSLTSFFIIMYVDMHYNVSV